MHTSVSRLFYCHGLPGFPEELATFAPPDLASRTVALNRLSDASQGYEESILLAFDKAMAGSESSAVLFGFSLGAMAALRIAVARPAQVSKVVLASPAAPLELGNFLDAMAGKLVFRAAQRGDLALRLLGIAQASALHVNWRALQAAMFRGSSKAERELMLGPAGAAVREGLRQCLGRRQHAYRRELAAYVAPWADALAAIKCGVEIWQGSEDSWTPPAMAYALAGRLSLRSTVRICEGLGHYSTLVAALERTAASMG